MSAFLVPMAMFFCLVDLVCACITWLGALPEYGSTYVLPSLDGIGLVGGYLFLAVWTLISRRDKVRRLYGMRAGFARTLLRCLLRSYLRRGWYLRSSMICADLPVESSQYRSDWV